MEQGTTAKLCECGCGQPAPIAKKTRPGVGHVNGQPVRFINGHSAKLKTAQLAAQIRPTGTGLCECGCGRRAPIARYTSAREGCVKGQPRRFIWGHSTGTEAAQRAARLYPEGVPPGVKVCECGCGLPAPIAPSNDPRRGYVKGEPRRFVAGHHRNLKMSTEVGERFGRGVVIEAIRIPRQGKTGGVVSGARLLCDCGNEYVKTVYVLRKGSVKSCGCLLRSKGGNSPELVARNCVLNDYQQSARDRGIAWELSAEDFGRLILMDCFYCGAPPQKRVRSKRSDFAYNGVDRIDSSGNYALGNALPACSQCNYAKKDMPYDEFMAWIARLTEYHFFHPELTPSRLLKGGA